MEAKHQLQLWRVIARWSRYDLIAIDEVGYVPLAEVGAEFLFQVVAERAEKACCRANDQLAILRVDAGDSERATLQSAAGSHHRPRAYPGDRHGILSFPPNGGEEEGSQSKLTGPGYGNDGTVESLENQDQVFHPSHRPWKSLRDSHIPTASTTVPIYKDKTQARLKTASPNKSTT